MQVLPLLLPLLLPPVLLVHQMHGWGDDAASDQHASQAARATLPSTDGLQSGKVEDMLAYYQLAVIKNEARAKREAERADEASAVRSLRPGACVFVVGDVAVRVPLCLLPVVCAVAYRSVRFRVCGGCAVACRWLT